MVRFLIVIFVGVSAVSCLDSGSGTLSNKQSAIVYPKEEASGDKENSSTYAVQTVSALAGGSLAVSETSENEKLRGMSVDIPPGALAIDTTITVKEVTDVANAVTTSALGINGGVAAGPSVAIEASDMNALTGSISISIPYDQGAGLVQDTANFVVIGVYRSNNSGYTAESFVGDELAFDGKFIKLSISKFGAYQAMAAPQPVEKKTAETNAGYVEKHIAKQAGTENYVAFLVSSPSDLPTCDASRLSHLYYVLKTALFYSCDGTNWAEVNTKGAKGDIGATGATGKQGESGVGLDPTLVLKRLDNGNRFGYLRGFGSQLWSDSDYGYYTGIKAAGTNYDVDRKTLYYSGRNCGGKKFIDTEKLAFDFRRVFYTFANSNPVGRINDALTEISPGSINRAGETCHNLSAMLAVKPTLRLGGTPYKSGNYLYFSGALASSNYEIWRTDGTEAGTTLLKDIAPGALSSDPYNFFDFNGKVYFLANDGTNGREIWSTDGTTVGTAMLKNIVPGPGEPMFHNRRVLGTKLLLSLSTPSAGHELWFSDGTAAGTLVADLNPGPSGSDPQILAVNGTNAFFTANDGTNGLQFWKTNGTLAGTAPLTLSNPDWSNSGVREDSVTQLGTITYFAAGDGIWRTDGTSGGTWKAKFPDTLALLFTSNGYGYSENMRKIVAVGTKVVVFARCYSASDAQCDGAAKLWSWDGSSSGGIINLWNISSNPEVFTSLRKVGPNAIFYVPNDGGSSELWRSDGTPGGTYILSQISPTYSTSPYLIFHDVAGRLVFMSPDYSKMIATDGTPGGTVDLINQNPQIQYINFTEEGKGIAGGKLHFFQQTGNSCSLYNTDGTAAGTSSVLVGLNTYCYMYQPVVFNGKMFFSADNYVKAITPSPLSVKSVSADFGGSQFFSIGSALLSAGMYGYQDYEQLRSFYPGTNNTTDENPESIARSLSEVSELTGNNDLPVGVLLKKGL